MGEWYFSVVDVVEALTDSVNPTDYLKKMRKRDTQLASYLGANCPQVAMKTDTGIFSQSHLHYHSFKDTEILATSVG